MMKKKLLSILLAAVLAAAVLGGCGGSGSSDDAQQEQSSAGQESEAQSQQGSEAQASQESEPSSSAAAEGDAEEITFPLAETVEITVATPDGTVASLADNLPLWQELEKRTNVKINWDVTAPAQYDEVMKLRVSASGDIPDVMFLPNGLNLGGLGGDGTILPLEDYIDKYGENIKKMYEEFPRVKSLTSADGHIYSINTVSENAYFMPYAFAIRKDWLDRLNLEEPETIDDWMTVLRAFRDQDADGDGDPNNEIPFSAGGHVWYTTFWAHAWDLHLFYSDGWYPDENGKMQYEFISDRAKEFFSWLNDFYEEGLLDPEFMTLGDENKLYEKAARNEVGAFSVYPSQIPMIEETLHSSGVEDAKLVPLIPPAGPYAQMVEIPGDMSVNGYVISSKCEHPEIVIALINYLMSDEGTLLMNLGVEGETYIDNGDGSYTLTEYVTQNPDGLSANEVLSAYGCQLGLPYIMSEKRGSAMLYEYDEEMRDRFVTVSEATRPYAQSGLVLPPATEEENEIIAGKTGDLTTYIWEMTGKFIVGTADVDTEWDTYVSKVKELGVDDILAVKQAQYDRLEK